ncbi:MAG: FAD-dependent oxidoreductase [Candidatus Baltobacteraceae bacterium]
MQELQARCVIAGGGPAGMMAGLLLARAGVDVIVLEKHADFFRDFRGDTIHPSTLQMLHEIGLLRAFLERPHDELQQLSGQVGTDIITLADFTALPTVCKFIALMPQWDFLNFLREQAQRFPTFRLLMSTQCSDLLIENGFVRGVRSTGPQGDTIIRAALVLAADGRHSAVRKRACLPLKTYGAPMDVLWMRIAKEASDTVRTLGFVGTGHMLVLIDRHTYWQAGFVIAKGTYERMRAQAVTSLHQAITALAPFLAGRMQAIASWNDISFLEVRVDRLKRWYRPGLLCIGDAAHAMSPIGGVGINLAIQDAVAAANLLWRPLSDATLNERDLHAVQRRRMFPTRATQTMQVIVQTVVVRAILGSVRVSHAPLVLRIVTSSRAWRRFMGRLVGLGFRPERIRSPIRTPQSEGPAASATRSV